MTQNGVSVTKPIEKESSVTFKFTMLYNRKPGDEGYDPDIDKERRVVREARYWYDIPLGALPVKQKGWPDMPEFMNGRQYFLWWKNNFEMDGGSPVIHNPYPTLHDVRYERAGEGSRRWGA